MHYIMYYRCTHDCQYTMYYRCTHNCQYTMYYTCTHDCWPACTCPRHTHAVPHLCHTHMVPSLHVPHTWSLTRAAQRLSLASARVDELEAAAAAGRASSVASQPATPLGFRTPQVRGGRVRGILCCQSQCYLYFLQNRCFVIITGFAEGPSIFQQGQLVIRAERTGPVLQERGVEGGEARFFCGCLCMSVEVTAFFNGLVRRLLVRCCPLPKWEEPTFSKLHGCSCAVPTAEPQTSAAS